MRSRACGEAARGSSVRLSSGSRVVMLTKTLTSSIARQDRQQIQIAQDQRALGDMVTRMTRALEHLEQRARHAQLALDRLIGIGVGADARSA